VYDAGVAKLEDLTVDGDTHPAVTDTSTSQTTVSVEQASTTSEEQTTTAAEAIVSSKEQCNSPLAAAAVVSDAATSKTKTPTKHEADTARTLDELTDADDNTNEVCTVLLECLFTYRF